MLLTAIVLTACAVQQLEFPLSFPSPYGDSPLPSVGARLNPLSSAEIAALSPLGSPYYGELCTEDAPCEPFSERIFLPSVGR